MDIVYQVHAVFGERILPLLVILAAIWFTVTWKPHHPPMWVARLFLILVGLQFALGLVWWIYGIAMLSGVAERYLRFPFILHPLLGLLAVVVARVSMRPHGFFSRLGRWAPLAALGTLLVLMLGNVAIASVTR